MSKTQIKKEESLLDKVAKSKRSEEHEIAIEDMPLKTYADYMKYNERARAANHRLKIARYPIKPCPVELHAKQRIVFNRNDQPRNPLPVYISDDKIDFKQTLKPGESYDLPLYVIEYLSKKGTPIWDWFDNPDGSRETRKKGIDPRFALRTLYAE